MQHQAAFHLGLHCLQKYSFRGFSNTKGYIFKDTTIIIHLMVWSNPSVLSINNLSKSKQKVADKTAPLRAGRSVTTGFIQASMSKIQELFKASLTVFKDF